MVEFVFCPCLFVFEPSWICSWEKMAQDILLLAIDGWVGGWVVFDQDRLLIIVHEHK